MKTKYRIQNADGTFLNAGTDKPSWFTLETARKTCGAYIQFRTMKMSCLNEKYTDFFSINPPCAKTEARLMRTQDKGDILQRACIAALQMTSAFSAGRLNY